MNVQEVVTGALCFPGQRRQALSKQERKSEVQSASHKKKLFEYRA